MAKAQQYSSSWACTRPRPCWKAGSRPAAHNQLPYAEFLVDLPGIEAAAHSERYLRTRMRLAHLPFHRTLEQFDFRFQPSVDEWQILEQSTLAFVANAANVIFLGPPGVGKRIYRYRRRGPGLHGPASNPAAPAVSSPEL